MGNCIERLNRKDDDECKDDSFQLFIWDKHFMFVDTYYFTQDIHATRDSLLWKGGPVRPKRLPKLDKSPNRIPLVCSFDFLRQLIDQQIYNRLDIDINTIDPKEFGELEELIQAHSSQLKLKIKTLRIRVRFEHSSIPYFTDTIEHDNFSWLRAPSNVVSELDPGVQITDKMLGKNELCVERRILNPEVLRYFRGSKLTLYECQEYGLTIDFITDAVERWLAGEGRLRCLYLLGFSITDEALHKLVHRTEMEPWELKNHITNKCQRCSLTNVKDVNASIIISNGNVQSIFFVVEPSVEDWNEIAEIAKEYDCLWIHRPRPTSGEDAQSPRLGPT